MSQQFRFVSQLISLSMLESEAGNEARTGIKKKQIYPSPQIGNIVEQYLLQLLFISESS